MHGTQSFAKNDIADNVNGKGKYPADRIRKIQVFTRVQKITTGVVTASIITQTPVFTKTKSNCSGLEQLLLFYHINLYYCAASTQNFRAASAADAASGV